MTLCIFTLFIFIATSFLEPVSLKADEHKKRYVFFKILTVAPVFFMFLCDDLFTYFALFEIMSFSSIALVAHEGKKGEKKVHLSYLSYSIIGGMISLVGLLLLLKRVGSLSLSEISMAVSLGTIPENEIFAICVLCMFGFAVKMGMFPLHTWLIGTYTKSLDPVTITLSCLLSKCGVFGGLLICLSIGVYNASFIAILLICGALTMFIAGLFGVLSDDLKETLSYSSMSQMGFMITGLAVTAFMGEDSYMALSGAIIYIINHGLIKLILFGLSSLIFLSFKTYDLNKLRGAGRGNPLIFVLFLIAGLSLLGLPGLNGYVGKSLIHESLIESFGSEYFLASVCEKIFLISGGFTFAYTLKLVFVLFIEKSKNAVKKIKAPAGFLVMLLLSALLIIIIGIFPDFCVDFVYNDALPIAAYSAHKIHYFSAGNISGALSSMAIGILIFIVYILFMRKRNGDDIIYSKVLSKKHTLESLVYIPIFIKFIPFVGALVARSLDVAAKAVPALFRFLILNNSPDTFKPRVQNRFGSYDTELQIGKIPKGVSYSLLLFIIGLGVILLYIFIIGNR